MSTGHSDTITDGVRIRVAGQYLPEHSDPDSGSWTYVYRVIMSNEGDETVRLTTRHWIITDADNGVEEVRGPGVVGEYPELHPGDHYEYMSTCPLRTPWGTMEGSYEFEREDGTRFDASIGRFFLAETVAPLSSLSE